MRGTISGTLDAEDYLAAQRLHQAAANARFLKLDIGLLLLGATIWGIARAWPGAAGWDGVGIIFIVGGAAAICIQLLMARIVAPRLWRRHFRQQKTAQTPFEYRVDADGLHVRTAHGQAMRPWNVFHKVRQNDRLVLLYHNDVLFEILAKRWFSDPEDIAGLLRHLPAPVR